MTTRRCSLYDVEVTEAGKPIVVACEEAATGDLVVTAEFADYMIYPSPGFLPRHFPACDRHAQALEARSGGAAYFKRRRPWQFIVNDLLGYERAIQLLMGTALVDEATARGAIYAAVNATWPSLPQAYIDPVPVDD